jgi:hypothetical protein
MAREKPESVALPGSSWRSEVGYAETPHINLNIIGYLRRVNSCPHAGVLVVGQKAASLTPGASPGIPKIT